MTGWSYRKNHVINHTSGAGTNYQVCFNVYRGSGSDSGNSVYLENHNASTFPNDIRWTDDDGTTLLDYWVEDSNSTWAKMWVEVKDDLSSVNRKIYIYYGKSGESSASNGEATEFFEDYETQLLENPPSDWTGDTEYIKVKNIKRKLFEPFNDSTPIISVSSTPSDFDYLIGSHCIIKVGDTYYCYYESSEDKALHGGTHWTIGLATSTDGINWMKQGKVLDVGSPGEWDDEKVWDPTVIKIGDTWHMWYGGQSNETYRLRYATSEDGENWTKDESNPILFTSGKQYYF